MRTSTDLGMNKTGIATSPIDSKRLLEEVERGPAPSGDGQAMANLRGEYAPDATPIGSVPPPATPKGVVKAAFQALTGNKPGVLLDKLGERLAFERTGSRLYELLIGKLVSLGSFQGGPNRERLVEIYNEEVRHFELLRETIESLGGDPTVQTPSADLAGVESLGLVQVLSDPRTNVGEALEAMLVAELVDRDMWDSLVELAESFGQDQMAASFRTALEEEREHLENVRTWVSNYLKAEATRDLKTIQP